MTGFKGFILKSIDDKMYAIWPSNIELEEHLERHPNAFPHCRPACCGGYDNALELTAEYYHSTGLTKAGNNISS